MPGVATAVAAAGLYLKTKASPFTPRAAQKTISQPTTMMRGPDRSRSVKLGSSFAYAFSLRASMRGRVASAKRNG